MTQPGSVIVPQPGWWVRDAYIGTSTSEYGWAETIGGLRHPAATINGTYGWHSAALSSPPILLDAVGGGAHSSGASSVSWSHTVVATGTVLLVWASVPQTQTVTATAGGTSMPLLESFNYTATSGYTSMTLAVFGLLNPPTGTQTISVHVSTADYWCANSVGYTNVNSFGGIITASGSTTSAALTASTDANHFVAQAFASDGYGVSTAFTGYNQTVRWNQAGINGGNAALLEIGDAAGAATVNFSATAPTSNGWGAVGVILPGILVSPVGVPSGEAFGTPTFTPGPVNISPTGIASVAAVGTPDLVYPQSISSPTGVPSGEAFGTPTVFNASSAISPTGITSGEAFGAPTVTSDYPLSPTGIGTGEAFGTPTVGLSWTAPTFDHTGISALKSTLASGTAFTWTQTVTSGAYGIIAIFSDNTSGTMTAPTASVTLGGVTLSLLGTVNLNNSSGNGWIQVYGGNGIPGGTQTASVTLTQSGKTFTGYGLSCTYNNVTSVGTLATNYGNGSTASVSVTPSTSNPTIIWGAIGAYGWGDYTYTGFNLTQRQNPSHANLNNNPIAGDTAVSSTSAFTISAAVQSNFWAAVGLSIL